MQIPKNTLGAVRGCMAIAIGIVMLALILLFAARLIAAHFRPD